MDTMEKPNSKVRLSDASKRVIGLIDLLKALKIVKSDRQFALMIGWQQQNVYGLREGARNIPESKIYDIERTFHLNKDYIGLGKLPVFSTKSEYAKYNKEIAGSEYLQNLLSLPRKKANNEEAEPDVQITEHNKEEGWILLSSGHPNKLLYPDQKVYLQDIYKLYNLVKQLS